MLKCNAMHPAVTRGRRLAVVVGQPKALAIAVRGARGRGGGRRSRSGWAATVRADDEVRGYPPVQDLGPVVTAAPEFMRGLPGFEELLFGAMIVLILLFLPGGLASLLARYLPPLRERYYRE